MASHVPWVLEGVELGANALEVGPGPGLTTDILHRRVGHLTCLEIDERLARSLQSRMTAPNVTVLQGDATAMPFDDASFDSALSFTMLHHVPSPALQDRLIAEVARVLRPGGVFAGRDSIITRGFRLLHVFDTMVMVDPATFVSRLHTAGFIDATVDVNDQGFRFRARRKAAIDQS